MFDIRGFGDQLWAGTQVTIELALASLLLGLVLGLLGATARLSGNRIARSISVAYTTVIRGIPELLTVLIIYFGATTALMSVAGLFGYEEYIEVGPFAAGVVALGLTFGAYASEVFRGAIQAIPPGQREAGLAIGMSKLKIFWRITLPQLWRLALPGLGNLFLVLLKDTALVSVVGLSDIMLKTRDAVNYTKEPFLFYMAAACIYLTLTIISMLFIHFMEKRNNRWVGRA
ncbi:MAG: ABC transporter permease [Amphritea sp.]|nr:ABC transporter permease [Amphritea sp.]